MSKLKNKINKYCIVKCQPKIIHISVNQQPYLLHRQQPTVNKYLRIQEPVLKLHVLEFIKCMVSQAVLYCIFDQIGGWRAC